MIVMAPGCLQFLLVGVLSVGPAVGASPLGAPRACSRHRPEHGPSSSLNHLAAESPTFRSDPQPVTVREAMGAVLVTAEPFRLLTDVTESRLAGCQPTRPDLPDARIQPEEIADRIGSLALAVFEEGEVSFTFRTTTNGAEYAITMDGTKSGTVQVSRTQSGELVLSATGAPLSVIRDRAEMFTCAGAADFTIRLAP